MDNTKLSAAPLSSYSPEDQAFFAFWYGPMAQNMQQAPSPTINHSLARYIWDAALAASRATDAPAKPGPMSEQNGRYAIETAIGFGREGTNKPPTDDHWLMPYWRIGQRLGPVPDGMDVLAVPSAPAQGEQMPIYQIETKNVGIWMDVSAEQYQLHEVQAGYLRRIVYPLASPVAADKPVAQTEPRTYMTGEQAFDWAWAQLKKDLSAERWNAGYEVQSWAFFKYGWDYRSQYERQRAAPVAASADAAPAGAVAVRVAALEEAAQKLYSMNDSAGDAAAHDNREMYPHEETRMWALADAAKAILALKSAAAEVTPAPAAAAGSVPDDLPGAAMHDVVIELREYAANPGFSHNDYADTMRRAAHCIESLRAMFFHFGGIQPDIAADAQSAEGGKEKA